MAQRSKYSVPIEPPTDDERALMREQYDEVLTVTNQSHLPMHLAREGDEPVCAVTWEEPSDREYRPHDMVCYPPGYKDICRFCVRQWRREQGADVPEKPLEVAD